MTKTYHHGDLRQALLTAGEAELEETGLEGFSLRKVARRAGVSHAAPAHHFGDVRGLLTALAARGFTRLLDMRAMRLTDGDMTARDRLMAYGLAYCAFAQDHTALFRLCFASVKPMDDDTDLSQVADRAFFALAEDVSEMTGLPLQDDVRHLADTFAIWGMVHGIADLLASGRIHLAQNMDPPEKEAFVKSLLTRAFPADGGQPPHTR